MEKSINDTDCIKCGSKETVKITITNKGDCVEVDIKKCTSCKKQSFIKEIFKDLILNSKAST